jgi:hypothetical protein
MTDIELNKVIKLARICNKNSCGDCRKKYSGKSCFSIDATIPSVVSTITTLADRLDALTAELAEKDRRVAELEAGQKHGKWVDDGRCCCKCTECGNHVLGNTSESLRRYNLRPYCENCGAKMDGE